MEYNFSEIERKWQSYWKTHHTYKVERDPSKPKYYVLDMFPYPSGAGLHVGHPLGYIASDIVSRYKRLSGFNVLHPMGYDAFGLPAEQYAIQTGRHPADTTRENIARYREQLDKLGFSFDWSREVQTCDPSYYKWTQWIFVQLFKSWYNCKTNRAESIDTLIALFEKEGFNGTTHQVLTGDIEHDVQPFTAEQWKQFSEKEQSDILMNFRLAYLGEAWVNWCPQLGTVLANDEVKDGVSERGGYPVERKRMPQWSLRITAYADRLLNDLEQLDWSESIKEAQRNWIGKSEGTSLVFQVDGNAATIEVFTTRPDTIFGVTFVTLAPEHDLVSALTTSEYRDAVNKYVEVAKNKSERERQAEKKVSGQFTGAYVLHPFTGAKIPVYIGEYVLAGYGTGAVMAVPAHDARDHAFAKQFGLAIPQVVTAPEGHDFDKESYDAKEGQCINSDFLNRLEVKAAIRKAIEEIEKRGIGKGKVNYRLRDAAFGRQRYWGEPIPVYYKNGIPQTMAESDLPLVLPAVDKFLPTESGEPPLARAKDWYYAPGQTHATPQPLSGGDGLDAAESAIVSDIAQFYKTADREKYPVLKAFARDMRKDATSEEQLIWERVRNKKLGHKIRRQHPIATYIADFVCIRKGVAIEIDGGYHLTSQQKELDQQRDEVLALHGFQVIRFTNEEVNTQLEKVIEKIKSVLDNKADLRPDVSSSGAVEALSTGEQGEVREAQGTYIQEKYPLETTTMPGWAGSSWYFLRYMSPTENGDLVNKADADYWKNVDLYLGGAEHATGHLLYVRFWTKFLYDIGKISVQEPAQKLVNQGMIQGMSMKANVLVDRSSGEEKYMVLPPDDQREGAFYKNYLVDFVQFSEGKYWIDADGADKTRLKDAAFRNYFLSADKIELKPEVEKMSKSKYNVVTPDAICAEYGADTLRLYEMFLGPLEQHKPWSTNGISGTHNFLKRFWRLFYAGGNLNISNDAPVEAELKVLHRTLKKIKEDIEKMSFNTAVSSFMICVNELTDLKCNKRAILEPLTIALAPFAPHITEELWAQLGHQESIVFAQFPAVDEKYLVDNTINYPVQFNGKMRFTLPLPADLDAASVEQQVLSCAEAQKYLDGKTPKKVIVVPKKIVNVVL
jgi:leucyl-tRNA synthetase